MKMSKLVLCFSLAAAFALCVFAVLGQSADPLLAGDTIAPQSLQERIVAASANDVTTVREVRTQEARLITLPGHFHPNASRVTPRGSLVAACLAGGKICNSNDECCSGLCGCQDNPGGRCNVC